MGLVGVVVPLAEEELAPGEILARISLEPEDLVTDLAEKPGNVRTARGRAAEVRR